LGQADGGDLHAWVRLMVVIRMMEQADGGDPDAGSG